MGTLFSALTVSLSGLQAATTQMQVVANNISNASTDGYTKKSAIVTTANLGSSGGGGVVVNGFKRETDTALYTTLCTATSNDGLRSTQNNYMQQVATLLGVTSSDSPPLTGAVDDFASAWTQLAAAPESSVQQQQVVQAAKNLTAEVQSTSESVETLDRQAHADINSSLIDLNSDLVQIQDLNQKISQAINANQSAGDLQDQRDQLVLKVSGMMKVTVLERSQGQIALYTSAGYQLVDGTSVRSFTYDGTDVTSDNNASLSLNNTLVGGSLQAKVDFRATTSPASTDAGTSVIQKLRAQLDEIVHAFTTTTSSSNTIPPADTFAAAYNNAATSSTITTELSSDFFTGTDRNNFSLNASLIDGSATIKLASADPVNAAMTDSTRAFTTDGLNAANVSYASLCTSILTGFQQAANSVGTLSDTSSSQKTYLTNKLTNETGVNVDTETVSLTQLENIYAASAHVMSVIQNMFDILEKLSA